MKKKSKIFIVFIFVVSMCFTSQISHAESENAGSFIVTGGVYGIDYEYTDVNYTRIACSTNESTNSDTAIPKTLQTAIPVKALVVKTSTPLTISTSGISADGIYIQPGVNADITFNNVNITAYIPFNIPTNQDTPTSVHLTLADNSSNSLVAKLGNAGYQSPGLRCGEGSYLTIDDERRNVDINGVAVEPKNGKVSREATLQDGTVVKKGDRLTILDSDNPGTLTVEGGYRASAIGGGPVENSGIMTFNGGNIVARAYGPTESRYGAGTGIGGGHAGGGTTITINGGNIDAYGSYHGAGFGGGCTYGGGMSNSSEITYAFSDAIFCKTPLSTIAGDININGGYLKARGYIHSNAFGQGCGGTNNGKTITITGGTLLPTSEGSFYDIGGAGGKVIVTGGSVRLTDNNKNKFQSSDGKAYDDSGSEVFMTTIDLKSENLGNNIVQNWGLYVDGELTNYGSPSMLDNGQLYLWLPKSAEGKEIRVVLAVQDDSAEGGILAPDDLFISDAQEGNATLKRFVEFEVPEEWQNKNLVKRYDGLAFQPYPLSAENYIETKENPVKKLTDPSKMTYKYQYYGDNDVLIGSQFDNLPKDSGKFQIVMTSTQFATLGSDFYNSYWGHRAYGIANIEKADITMDNASYDTNYYTDDKGVTQVENMKLHVDIHPSNGEAKTCEAPDGYVQFYINGVKVGDAVKLIASADKTSAGYAYSSADLTLQFKDNPNYPRVPESLTDERFIVTAKYYDSKNYNDEEIRISHKTIDEQPDIDEFEEPENFPYVTPPIPVVTPTPPETLDEEINGDEHKPDVIVREETDGDKTILHSYVYDKLSTSTKPNTFKEKDQIIEMLNHRYTFANSNNTILEIGGKAVEIDDVTIIDTIDNDKTLDYIDMSKEGAYTLIATVEDIDGNKTTLELTYYVNQLDDSSEEPKIDLDVDGDGFPDTNLDTDKDGKPDINIDVNGDGEPDINIDTDNDGKPDINIDTDGDGKPDINIDTDGDDKPDVNIVDKDGDGKPDNLDDLTKEEIKDLTPDVNIDTDKDGKPDINIDTDNDGKPDINIDKDGDGKPDINIDTDGDDKPDINIVDKDGDGKPDDLDKLTPDEIKDLTPDVNVDTDGDGKADINIDVNGDGKPDINIDTDGDGKADINIDKDGDGKVDYNIDTDGDGIADANILGVDSSDHTMILTYLVMMISSIMMLVILKNKKKVN